MSQVDFLKNGSNGHAVFIKRFAKKEGSESPADALQRVAEHIASNSEYGSMAYDFFEIMHEGLFLPNSPTFTGAGQGTGQLAACFVLPLEDDLGTSPGGIFSTLRNAALIQQTGGGNGFNFGRLRPKGTPVVRSHGVATGPVGFLKVFDAAFGEIAQAGARRGANMAVMPVSHPDIEEFIDCKMKEGDIANFNISVAITDQFMLAVLNDEDFELEFGGKVYRTVRARELFEKITKYAHRNGEPGALFIDKMNETNPVPHLYTLEATNPCGEQALGPNENCCLGSINLANHVRKSATLHGDGRHDVDWDLLAHTARTATSFLDAVVSANAYVDAVPALKEAALKARRIGLGIMGLADLLYKMGVGYATEEGRKIAADIMHFIRYQSMWQSMENAKLHGAFPAIEGSIYDSGNGWVTPIRQCDVPLSLTKLGVDWDVLDNEIRMHGIRNAAQTTIAPTGTLATVSGLAGYGCEPAFALVYTRKVMEREGEVTLNYFNPDFAAWVDDAYEHGALSEEEFEKVKQTALETGSIASLNPDDFEVPEAITCAQEVFVTSGDISPRNHILMQAALQQCVDNSLSKTINMPASATEEDVREAYTLAWKTGCKGVTVYVTGSRNRVVLETKETKEKKSADDFDTGYDKAVEEILSQITPVVNYESYWADDVPAEMRVRAAQEPKMRRPDIAHGQTVRTNTPFGKAYVTVNSEPDGEPFEVFVNLGKSGTELHAVSEAFGRLLSLYLRTASPISRLERLEWAAEELSGIGGGSQTGFGPAKVKSLADAVGKVLNEYVRDKTSFGIHDGPLSLLDPFSPFDFSSAKSSGTVSTEGSADMCPDCGQATLIFREGCESCVCGFSKC